MLDKLDYSGYFRVCRLSWSALCMIHDSESLVFILFLDFDSLRAHLTTGVSLTIRERDLRRRASPTGFRTRGLDFVKAADILLADHYAHLIDKKTRTPSSTVYYNYVHGIELLLKSYLLHTGTSLEDIERYVRQDIDEALTRCMNCGLRDVCPDLDTVAQAAVVGVSEPYWRKRFEYLRVEGLHLPHVGHVAEAAHALVAGLRYLKMERWQSLSTD